MWKTLTPRATVTVVGFVVVVGSASAEVLAGPDATKLCAGHDGGGIRWSIGLNEGWRESRFIRYRVTLIDPRDRRLNMVYGRFGGYWDYGTVTPKYTPNILSNPVVGVYRFILEVRVDHRYADIRMIGTKNFDWPHHADRWVQYRPGGWKIRVYNCG